MQWGRMRWIVAFVGTIQQTIKYLSPVLIYFDKEGDWHNVRRDAIFVSPELNVSVLDSVRSTVKDVWCYKYNVQVGDVVVDIGAGIGDEVVIFSNLVGDSGWVIAIEAHPDTYRCLIKTIKLNRLTNVIPINAAVSDKVGELCMSDEPNHLSNNIFSAKGKKMVRAEPFDLILDRLNIERVSLIKMNIEGAETIAILGMGRSLKKTANIVVECHDFKANRGESEEFRTYARVSDMLKNHGYNLDGRPEDLRPEVRYTIYGARTGGDHLG